MVNSKLKLKLAHEEAQEEVQRRTISLPNETYPYAALTNDVAFKIAFTDKEMLLGLLKELLPNLFIEEINEITTSGTEDVLAEVIKAAENNIQFDSQEVLNRLTDRKAIMDIACTTASGEKINIEMQNDDHFKQFSDRSLYYATLEVQEQMTKGLITYKVKPIYSISFLNFNMLEDSKYISSFSLRDDETMIPYKYNKLHFTYIELQKFNKKDTECTTLLDRIIYTLKHSRNLKSVPNSFKNDEYMEKLFKFALFANYTPTQRKLYEAKMYTAQEYLYILQEAKNDARAAGLAEGKAKGLAEGKAAGLAEGEAKGRAKLLETAKNMLADGMAATLIARYTGLTESEIKALQQN